MSGDFIFLHGGGQGSWVWDETIEAMRQQASEPGRLLALDVPGCGTKRGRDTSNLEVPDIVASLIADIDAAGIGCEPASAASVAGVRKLVGEGVIRKGESVVAVLTGHLLKDPGAVIDFHSRPGPRRNPPVTIAPRLAEVERQLRRL